VGIIKALYLLIRAFLVPRLSLAAENLALRQQLAVYKHSVKRPIYGDYFKKRVKDMGIDEVPIAPQAPWQNPYCERIIGSIRRDCLDHVIVLNEAHLHRILTEYFQYDHRCRPHLSLDRNSPTPRCIERPSEGEVVAIPQVGGLHHRYTRCAA